MLRNTFGLSTIIVTLLLGACDTEDTSQDEAFRSGSDSGSSDDSGGPPPPAQNRCESLTPAAIQQPIDRLNDAIAKAQENIDAHPNPNYDVAGPYALANFIEARDTIVAHQDWLTQLNLDVPFVSNTSAAGGTYQIAMLQASDAVAMGAWWSGIAAIYDQSVEARAAADLGTEANVLLAQLGSDAMSCYMRLYFPE